MVHIRVKDEATAKALRSRLGQDFPVHMFNGSWEDGARAAVVTTANDTSPAECSELTHHGYAVVLLVPAVRQQEREAYVRAGARAYLEMSPDATELVRALRALDAEVLSGRAPAALPHAS